MIAILLAALRKKPTVGGGSFELTSLSVSGSSGTSCESPALGMVSIAYTGSPSGITLKLEHNHNGEGWEVVGTGLSPVSSFPYSGIDLRKYYNKFAAIVEDNFRVTNEADSHDQVLGSTSTTAIDCGA